MKPHLVAGWSADRFSGGATFSPRGNPRLGVGTAAAYQFLERDVAPFIAEDCLLNPRVETVTNLLRTDRLIQEVGASADNCFNAVLGRPASLNVREA